MMPKRMAEVEVMPLVKCFSTTMTTSTAAPTARFSREPKSLAPEPPAKELTPTEMRLRPMASTTVPVTTGGNSFRRGLMKKPRTVSNKPPMMEAPRIAP